MNFHFLTCIYVEIIVDLEEKESENNNVHISYKLRADIFVYTRPRAICQLAN